MLQFSGKSSACRQARNVIKHYDMTKLSLLIVFISAFMFSFGQVDTTHVNGQVVLNNGVKVTEWCPTTTIKNKTYEFQVGATFNRTVLASGWFIKSSDSCYRSTWIQKMINEEFYLSSKGVYKKYKKGKPISGKVREDDGEYKIMGRCKKGLPSGKFIILNSDNELIWKGKIYNLDSE
jgi:hypothetical protein